MCLQPSDLECPSSRTPYTLSERSQHDSWSTWEAWPFCPYVGPWFHISWEAATQATSLSPPSCKSIVQSRLSSSRSPLSSEMMMQLSSSHWCKRLYHIKLCWCMRYFRSLGLSCWVFSIFQILQSLVWAANLSSSGLGQRKELTGLQVPRGRP